MPMTLAEEMIHSTVKIEATAGGVPIASGTAFFWGTNLDADKHVLSLVTNKHVLAGADGFIVFINTAEHAAADRAADQFVRHRVELAPEGQLLHPDPAVDLVAVNMTQSVNQMIAEGYTPFYRMLGRETVPDAATWQLFDSIEDVYMIGCPNGISDAVSHRPLVRRGITATAINRDYDGAQEFMVDLACFPGSSGSPVFFYNPSNFLEYRQPDGSMKRKPNGALLGVLHAGPVIDNQGRIVLNQAPQIKVAAMMHLGQVIRATRLLELDDLILAAVRAPRPVAA